nr:cation:proton antiporter [uncultured Desulfobacter sp.]
MGDLMNMAVIITFTGLIVSFVLAFIRLVLGPTHADRLIALDLIGSITISFIAVFTITSGQTAFLDIAITLALVMFVSTVAFVTFMKSRLIQSKKNKEEPPWKS